MIYITITLGIVILFMVWYVYSMMKQIVDMVENIRDYRETIGEFTDHLKGVYSMETFYGDETLQGLLGHGREVVEELEGFERYAFFLETGEDEDLGEDEEEGSEEETEG